MDISKIIDDLLHFAFNNPNNEQKIVDIAIVDQPFADKINQFTGLELFDFTISIDNFGLLHSFRKHGNNLKETSRGQIEITKEDIGLIQTIIFEADTIKLIKGNLVFEKKINNHYFVVKEIRRIIGRKKVLYKKNRLVLKTMYKRKSS
jgi:hypothetical protein